MIPKFRAYAKRLDRMMEVTVIDFEEQEVELLVARDGGLTSAICAPFDDIELMQSTGLFDKNGVEIFEGDVVTNSEDPELKFEIKLDVLAGIYSKVSDGDIQYLAASSEEEVEETREDFKEYLEVIGNIYENPELMEVTD